MKIKQAILEKLYIVLTCYDDKKYWKFAKYMRDPRISIIAKYYYLYRLKRMEVKNCASLGFRINGGPRFVTPPITSWNKRHLSGTGCCNWRKCDYLSAGNNWSKKS